MKSTIFWVITPCITEIVSRTAEKYLLQLQGKKVNQTRKRQKQEAAYFMPELLFDPEDGSDTFFRNVELSPNYTVLQRRSSHDSQSQP
jgi:hypothetical protein